MEIKARKNVLFKAKDQERPIILVDLEVEGEFFSVLFYKSTGINSKMAGTWFPIVGILNKEFLAMETIKDFLEVLGGVEKLQKNHSQRWFIKFPGGKRPGEVERMSRNLKYGRLFQRVSAKLSSIEDSLQTLLFEDQLWMSRALVRELKASNERSVYLWIAACCSSEDPCFSEVDLL